VHVLIDHLNAIIVAVVLLTALVVIHLRDSQHAIEETIGHTADRQAAAALNVVGRDLDNLLGPEQADVFLGDYQADFVRTDSLTTSFVIPTMAASAAGAIEEPAHVFYTLEATGRTVISARGDSLAVYQLRRQLDFGDGLIEAGLMDGIVDFRVAPCVRDACAPEGVPSDSTTHLQLSLAAASEIEQIDPGTGQNRPAHLARVGTTYRPQNLPANREAAASGGSE
jgi:hypothetical protein